MNFRRWLEADEQTPFEQWHDEWLANWHSRDRYGREYHRLKDDPRRKIRVASVVRVSAYSSGMHSFGPDQEDVPAGNPFFGSADWEYDVETTQQEAALVGKKAFVADYGWGSFHEQMADLRVYVIIPESDWQTLEIIDWAETFSRVDDFRKIDEFFIFKSVRDAAEKLMDRDYDIKNPSNPGETRDQYWARIVRQTPLTHDPDVIQDPEYRYDARDDYYKRKFRKD